VDRMEGIARSRIVSKPRRTGMYGLFMPTGKKSL
jgi:hypothetical protein